MVSEKAREESECMGVKDEAGGRKRRTRPKRMNGHMQTRKKWQKKQERDRKK